MRLHLSQLGYKRVKFESVRAGLKDNRKKMQVCQYPHQSGIQRQGGKQCRESHFTLIKGIIHKEILTIGIFSAANFTAVRSAKQTVRA